MFLQAAGRAGDDKNLKPDLGAERSAPDALPPRSAGSSDGGGRRPLPLRLPLALALLATVLLIVATPQLGTTRPVLILPWFVPTITALTCLTFGVLAFLGYLRYATSHFLYPIVFALTCWAEMLFNFGFLLAWPGLVGSGGVIGDTPWASAYFFVFALLVLPFGLGIAHLAPPLTAVTTSRWFVPVVVLATTILCGLLIAVVAAWDEHLPPLARPDGSYTPLLIVADVVGAGASLIVAGLAWRRYCRNEVFLPGIAAVLLVGQVGVVTVLLGLARYDISFYGFHLVRAAIWAMALFAVLGEYVQFYRVQARLLAFERARRDRLYEVARALAGTRDIDRVAAQVVEATRDLLGAAGAALYRYDSASGKYVLQAASGLAEAPADAPPQPALAVIPLGPSAKDGVLALPDVLPHPAAGLPPLASGQVRALVSARLPGQPAALGILEAYFDAPRRFPADERELLRALADTSAPALENAQLFAELQVSQQRAEEAAGLAVARRVELETVVQALPEGIVFVNRRTGERRGNPAAAQLLGLTLDEIAVGSPIQYAGRVLHPSGEAYRPDELPLTRALEQGEATVGEELVYLGHGGEPRYMLASAAPMRTDDGEIIGGVLVFQDITSLKELEHERDRFLSLVVHELRNPLAAIKGLAQVVERRLRQGLEVDPSRLGLVTRQVDELHRLTADLSDLSRLQAGRFDLDPERFDLAALLHEAVEQQRAASPQHGVELRLGPEPLWVEADRQRIGQVLTNLLQNAVKYSPEADRIEIMVERDERVRVRVRDFGIGVPAEARSLLFQRFQRAANARRQPGLGLGLYISQTLAQASGGDVGYEPAEPGSVFWLELPLVAAPTAATRARRSASAQAEPASPSA